MSFTHVFKPLIVFSVITNVLMLAAPLHMMQVYDRVLSSGSKETLLYITLIAVFFLALYGVCEAIRSKLAQRISAQYAVTKAEPLFQGITSGSVPVEKSNEIIRNFNTTRMFISSRTMIGFFDLPFSPLFLVLLYLLHFQIGLITTVGAALLVTVAWFNKTLTAEDQKTSTAANSKAIGFATAMTTRSEDILAMGLLPSLVQRWGDIMRDSLNAQDIATGKSATFFGISKGIRQILQISIMAWGAWLVLNGDMSGGLIFAASMISGKALQPIEQVIGGWDSINRARIAHAEIEKVLKNAQKNVEKIEQPTPIGNLNLHDVSLVVKGLKKEHTILSNINFQAKPGTISAVVGPSGSGKSTFARIIAGAVKPTQGEVMLDGCLQTNWPVEQWGENVGYVGQELLLFPGTIAENIARMSISPDEKQIITAASLAGAHDLINSFTEGYMTQLGDGALRLSGGQKQRIALARALYTLPKLLVLDEPNAHLDKEGEEILMGSMKQLRDLGTTIIIITQRQEILKIADNVMMIKNGRQVDLKKRVAPKEMQTITKLQPKLKPAMEIV